MKKEDAVKLSEEAMKELAAALAAGKSKELELFLDAMSRFHNYSFGNCMLIALQKPNATLIAGFQAWKKHGRQVKKGEKGICILAPMVGKSDDDEDEGKKVFGFRAVHVFDVSQTEGDEMPEPARVSGDPGDKLLRLHQVVTERGITLCFEEDLEGAAGIARKESISLLRGLSPAEEFNTLAHELAHTILHFGEDRKQFTKSVRELEAESVTYVVSRAAGLGNALKQSVDYIHCYEGDSDKLSVSLTRIQKTASLILTELESARKSTTVETQCVVA